MHALIENTGGFELLEFSISNVIAQVDEIDNAAFFDSLFRLRQGPTLGQSFQDYVQLNSLGTFGRQLLRKQ